MSKQTKILLGISVVVLLGIGVWLGIKGVQSNSQSRNTWKTYSYQRFGHYFSIDLPKPLFSIRDDMESNGPYTSGLFAGNLMGFDKGGIRFYLNSSNKPLRQWLLEDHQNKEKELQRFSLDHEEAYKVISNMGGNGEYLVAFVKRDNLIYEISVGEHISRVDALRPFREKIIRSFKFLTPPVRNNSIVSTANWKIFHDDQLALSFQYPNQWKVLSAGDGNEHELAITDPEYPALQGRIFLTSRFGSYEEFRKSYQGSQSSLLIDATHEIKFANKPAVAAEMKIGNRSVGRCLFTSDQLYKPFMVCYEPGDPIQKAIIDSFQTLDTESSSVDWPVKEKYMFVAMKKGTEVNVKRINIFDKSEELLFTYNESRAASAGGNAWEGQPPSVALSHDGKKVAYTSSDGLFVRDLLTKQTSALITKLNEPSSNTDEAPIWSDSQLKYVHIVSRPRWSAGDRYISFNGAYGEGATTKIIQVSSKKVIDLKPAHQSPFGTSLDITWSGAGLNYVIPNGYGYQEPGLFISNPGNLSVPIDYSPYIVKNTAYFSAEFSTDEKQIIGLRRSGTEGEETKNNVVFVLDVAHKKSFDVAEVQSTQKPFFGKDSTYVYYASNTKSNTLTRYNVQTKKAENGISLPKEFDRWEKIEISPEGYLVLWASVQETSYGGSNTNRVFIVDPQDSRIVYSSKLYKGFTTFLGLVE